MLVSQLFKERLILVLLIILSFFFYFYNLPNNYHFAGDQGRDVLVIKDILLDKHLQLLGPTTSVGNYYLGPFYYYFIAPSLFLASFNPLGLAVFQALLGVITVIILFLFLRSKLGLRVASFASFWYLLLPTFIKYNRFAWNPNPIPLFFILFVCSLTNFLSKKKIFFFILSLVNFGILLQLHLVTLVLALPLLLTIGWFYFDNKLNKKVLKKLMFMFGSFLIALFFSVAPLIISILKQPKGTSQLLAIGQIPVNLLLSLISLFKFVSGESLPIVVLITILGIISLGFLLYKLKQNLIDSLIKTSKDLIKNHKITSYSLLLIVLLSFVATWVGVSALKVELEAHYLFIPILSLIIIISWGVDQLLRWMKCPKNIYSQHITLIIITILISISWYKSWTNIFYPQEISANKIKQITRTVLDSTKGQPFQLAVLSSSNSVDPYQYFFELDKASLVSGQDVAKQIFIICETEDVCQPLGNPDWEIAKFQSHYLGQEVLQTEVETNSDRIYRIIKLSVD